MIKLFSLAILIVASLVCPAEADIITRSYDLVDYVSEQDESSLQGFLAIQFDTTNTGGVFDEGNGNYSLLASAVTVTSWSYTVSKAGFSPFTISSTDVNDFGDATGGGLFFSSPTAFSSGPGANLRIGVNDPTTGQTLIDWNRGGDFYFANYQGNVSPRGWLTNSPNIPLDGNNAWVVATAIPEPASFVFLAFTSLGLAALRRRAR